MVNGMPVARQSQKRWSGQLGQPRCLRLRAYSVTHDNDTNERWPSAWTMRSISMNPPMTIRTVAILLASADHAWQRPLFHGTQFRKQSSACGPGIGGG